MRGRTTAVLISVAAVLATACSSDDDGGSEASTTQLTLLPTTTTTVPPSTTATLPPTTLPPVTTTTSTTTTSIAPSTTLDPVAAALVMTSEGIGSAAFGAEPEGVISYVGSFLGMPTGDTGWIDPFELGACPGTEVRIVSWGVLSLTFGDVSTVTQGRRHFFAYSYGVDGQIGAAPAGLVTSEGITVGSRVVDVLAAYPGAVLNPEDDFVGPNFYVNDNLRGFLTGLADDATVTVVLGGQGCAD